MENTEHPTTDGEVLSPPLRRRGSADACHNGVGSSVTPVPPSVPRQLSRHHLPLCLLSLPRPPKWTSGHRVLFHRRTNTTADVPFGKVAVVVVATSLPGCQHVTSPGLVIVPTQFSPFSPPHRPAPSSCRLEVVTPIPTCSALLFFFFFFFPFPLRCIVFWLFLFFPWRFYTFALTFFLSSILVSSIFFSSFYNSPPVSSLNSNKNICFSIFALIAIPFPPWAS